VLFQFVRDLVNDESAAGRERIVGLLKQGALLVDLQDAEWDPGNNVIARTDAAPFQFTLTLRGGVVEHVNARIVPELSLQIARESGIDLEQQKLAVRTHPPGDLARMNAFARAVFGAHLCALEIDFVGHPFNQSLRAGHNGGDLERAFQESLEEKGAHRKTNSHPHAWHCPVGSARGSAGMASLRVKPTQTKD